MSVIDIYLDLLTLKQKPVMQAFIDRLTGELLEWASKNNEALTIKEFVLGKGITWQTFLRWTKTREPLKSAYEDVKLWVGIRREKGMIKKQYDSKSIMHIQHMWDDDWKQADEYHSNLRKKEQGEKQQGPIHIHMDSFDKKDEK